MEKNSIGEKGMKNIKIILNENKTFTAENIDEVKILEDEHNATVIEVHFPEDYANYSKRVDFLNIRNEKWTTSLYAPEDENNKYSENFDKSMFRFTIPSAMAKRGELQIQFIAYLVDGSNTIVPFQVILATINKSIIYAVKEGRENPDLLIKTYEYSNEALRVSRESFEKIDNAERAALESEESAKHAENSAKSAQASATNAQNSANSANSRAINAEASAKSAQTSAEYAEQVSDNANAKSDQAVATSNSANVKSDNAVSTANTANSKSDNAINTANTALSNSENAISTSNTASTKSDNAVNTANEALETANEALNQVVEKMGTKIFIAEKEVAESSVHVDEDIQEQLNKIKNNTTIVSNSSGGFSCGTGATNGKGMQFKGFTICDENGKIPVARLFEAIYPVGSIYISSNSTNPGTLFGGTWEAYAQGRTLIGNGTSDQAFNAGATGGSSTHTLTTNEMPSHTHTQNSHNHSQNSHTHTFHGYNQTGYVNNIGMRTGNGTSLSSQIGGVFAGSTDPGQSNADGSGSGAVNINFSMTPTGYNDATTATNNATTATNNNTGGGASHNNLQPYIVTYIWRRTA